jgi:hypothetical protein
MNEPIGVKARTPYVEVRCWDYDQNKTILGHRIAWFIHHGYWPNVIDHINLNKKDNRIENLRDVDYGVNNHNYPIEKRNRTGYRGISQPNPPRWVARLGRKRLGSYDTLEEAVSAWNKAAIEKYGEYAAIQRTDNN